MVKEEGIRVRMRIRYNISCDRKRKRLMKKKKNGGIREVSIQGLGRKTIENNKTKLLNWQCPTN